MATPRTIGGTVPARARSRSGARATGSRSTIRSARSPWSCGRHVPRRGDANLYLFVTHKGAIVHAVTEHRTAPAAARGRLLHRRRAAHRHREAPRAVPPALRERRDRVRPRLGGVSPASSIRRRRATSSPATSSRAAASTGTVTLGGTAIRSTASAIATTPGAASATGPSSIAGPTCRASSAPTSGSTRSSIDLGEQLDIRIGCLWDGSELLALQQLEIEPRTVEGGSRQVGVERASPTSTAASITSRARRSSPTVRCGWAAPC